MIFKNKVKLFIKDKRNSIKYIFGIAIGMLFFYLAFHNIDFNEMYNVICGANYWYIFLSILIIMLSHYLRAIRWQVFLFPIRKLLQKVCFQHSLSATQPIPFYRGIQVTFCEHTSSVKRTLSILSQLWDQLFLNGSQTFFPFQP